MTKKSKEDIHYKKNKANKKTKSNNVSARNKNDELFDFDKEIVIGMPRISDDKEKNKKNKKTSVNTNKNKQNAKKKITKQQQIAIKKKKAILKIVKVLTLIIVIIGVSIYVALSPLFNIKEINVTGNSKLSKEEIISLSELKTDENTFKVSKKNIKNKVKANAYIENVKIRRKLPDKVEIIVVERVATYMIPFANSYIYINNQGYMLEITSQKAEMPAIVGISTPEEELHEGQRLISEDLVKLGEVLQIMESANANELVDLITKIDISNRQDYILTLEKEKKAIHLGDVSNLSTKMAYVKKILNDEKGVEGEILVNTDLTNKGAVFREKV
ncbi:MAG TPA: FtsQ-type POTRA domain-containing protein [Clostridiaceae bacterium]|nr:FtsQ-type POTRA domain-containing protein [Clostridia bacterium]HJJ08719.1 FtsQ-type POTRA domain-containing protein [Clostridiaceae bacterium]